MISKKMHQLGSERSYIRELFEYGKKKAAEIGAENVMDFSLGNPSIPAPQAVEDAIKKLMAEETPFVLHSYTSSPGDEQARAVIAASLSRRFATSVQAEHLFLTSGAAAGLISCLKAVTTDAQSEIIVLAPFFPEYKVYVEDGAGARLQIVDASPPDFQINFDLLAQRITANTRAVIVNSPNNPSGVVYTRATLERLGALLLEKSEAFSAPIYLISDEPYRELVYGDAEVPYVPDFYDNTLVCYSFSKSLSLPGERIGYVLVPPSVSDAGAVYSAVAGAARAIGHVCAPSLMQRVIALCCDVAPDKSVYERNRQLLYDEMTRMGYRYAKPDGAFYLFFEAPGGLSGREFSNLARDRHNLLVVPGDAFGCQTYLRMSYCVPTERIEQALPFLAQLIEELK